MESKTMYRTNSINSTIKDNRSYNTTRSSSSKWLQSLKKRSFMKKMKHAQPAIKILIRKDETKNYRPQNLKRKNSRVPWVSSLKSQVKLKTLFQLQMTHFPRYETNKVVYILTYNKSIGFKPRLEISEKILVEQR